MQFVDEASIQGLLKDARPAITVTALSPAAAIACATADSMPSVTNVKVKMLVLLRQDLRRGVGHNEDRTRNS